MEQQYKVIWEIDIWASTAESAAKQALCIQRSYDSIATVFTVVDEFDREVEIDLGRHGFVD